MISKKVETALNQQIVYEGFACGTYLAMAAWCQREGFRNSSKFFYQQSDEEREHMLKIVKYLSDVGGTAVIPAFEKPLAVYKELKDLFDTSLKQEQDVSKKINKLLEISFEAKDFATHRFLQWYVDEQFEEEALFTAILDLFRHAGKLENALFLIDNEIPKIRMEFEAKQAK